MIGKVDICEKLDARWCSLLLFICMKTKYMVCDFRPGGKAYIFNVLLEEDLLLEAFDELIQRCMSH